VAVFTKPAPDELAAFVASGAFGKTHEFLPIAGGSVNSNFRLETSSGSLFLRIYEEQDERGAAAEATMVSALAARGVPTPAPCARGVLAGKPAAVFPWVEGTMSCQRAVTPERARAVGAALAGVHLAGRDLAAPAHRFGAEALRARLATIDPAVYPVARLARALGDLDAARDPSLPAGLVHGDLFRDNVLFRGDAVTALLDFESAYVGPLAYDLAVTVLAWCYGDALDRALMHALVAGYESVRSLEAAEKRALATEARFAAVRFAITRITDYAMRPAEGRVMKDWRRFVARLDALKGGALT